MSNDPFKTRLQIAKSKLSKKNIDNKNQNSSSLGAAFKLSTELVSAVAVGTIIGFILDKTFGTKPWLIIIFFFVGVVAGIINVIRSAKNMQK
jgi:ATP synthase protein I|tara:strand:+ start:1440 stop:1715 length:276 start_codon:yes stop_codon:yes gene_type:complete